MEIKYPLDNLIPEIVSRENLYASIDYVIDHLECKHQRDRFRPDKTLDDSDPEIQERWNRYYAWRDKVYNILKREIETGEFSITRADVQDIHVKDGPKERDVQAPNIVKRCGINAIMVVVEKYTRPALIKNTAASIKGRGMHWLHHIIEEDLVAAPDMSHCSGQTDIVGYYDNIPQDGMKATIRIYICDQILLIILDRFITLMPKGLSKGLRSSQCLANLYLNTVHHRMLQEVPRYMLSYPDGTVEVRYLYYSYCDDTDFLAPNKKEAWRLMHIYMEEVSKLGLTVKPNYAVRPMTEGLDCLGYVHYRDAKTGRVYSLIRKRVKQNAARKLAKVKSRKRRQQIIGSFKGMACHADCKHLFYILTHHRMQKFSEMGISYTPANGKEMLPGNVVRLAALQNKTIEVHKFISGQDTGYGKDHYIVSCRDPQTGAWMKFFTSSEEMKQILEKVRDVDGFPFETVIQSEVFDGNKVKYKFT